MSKSRDARYRSGRCTAGVKIKNPESAAMQRLGRVECVMLTPEQVRQVAEHLALHLPAIVEEKTERGALVAPANQKRLYLDVTEVETVLRTALRAFEL